VDYVAFPLPQHRGFVIYLYLLTKNEDYWSGQLSLAMRLTGINHPPGGVGIDGGGGMSNWFSRS